MYIMEECLNYYMIYAFLLLFHCKNIPIVLHEWMGMASERTYVGKVPTVFTLDLILL